MKRKELPFELNPVIRTYHERAYPLGIVMANAPSEKYWLWLCQKYINCMYVEFPEPKFDVVATDRFFYGDHIIIPVAEFSIFQETLKKVFSRKTLIKSVEKSIDNNVYVIGNYNEFFVSCKSSFRKKDFAHDYIIFGYDKAKKLFLSAGYTNSDLYQKVEIPYDEFCNAFFGQKIQSVPIRFLKYNKQVHYKTKYDVVSRDIRHYISSTAYQMHLGRGEVYGINTWYKLTEVISSSDGIDLRFTRIFMEHRLLMFRRLEYLTKLAIISSDILNGYRISSDFANQIFMLSIKYNLSHDTALKDKIVELILECIAIDLQVLPIVADCIERIML